MPGSRDAGSRDVDGLLVGYGNVAPEPLIELVAAGKARDYAAALVMANRKRLKGNLANAWWQNVLDVLGLIAVITPSVRLFDTLFLS